ncbi:hypothetical protein GDO81_017260 [Engystomops pustulosus]|uniref:Methyltransferase type 11 domain-containing protein n=1 Tax=Engystomops pustulosus TaxID=76066 RepID=A0AAV7AGK2_ENGPU|nr:hypothetical protein GDO81_017260 [Engystomops pustulosus]KAG8559168.1 hypothetical protein GDO81_017260 [Engystomops pustulosus]KAG8559169.1 hypothetical protein GDO81_017260 [Engystomops pustulosus]KAG8559170.1 hypothetical protein GDO81_017260 [Engystomops pustulosus]
MAVHLFNKKAYALIYQKDMIPASKETAKLILYYVKNKTNEQPLDMALDVGCGSGRSTLPLAPHFNKVLGVDISDSQINVAKQYNTASNVSFMMASAENLPLKDASVDLINVCLAAHWFQLDKFFNEAIRVLKKKGCLAVHGIYPDTDFEYKDFSYDLNAAMSEVWDTLHQHDDKTTTEFMINQYQDIYEAVPLKDKERIINIPETTKMTISDVMGIIRSAYMYQTFLEKDPIKAKEFFRKTKESGTG